jgi:Cu/Zn superoxide dismutase
VGIFFSGNVNGILSLRQNEGDPLTITGMMNGEIPKGSHGFHVHEKADLSEKCNKTGSHYNPFNVNK